MLLHSFQSSTCDELQNRTTSSAVTSREMAARTMQAAEEEKPRQQQDESLKCPRCDSTNSKFCYYNNYSLSQPRCFCKSCRRFWTKGGTLRNVPIGGGCRRSQRSVTSSSSSIRNHDHDPISPFAPVAYESPHFAPFMHKLISGHETCYGIPYPIAHHDCNLPSSAGFLNAIKGGLESLENNQCDASGSYHGLGVRTTPIAEGIHDDGGCDVNFRGEGENNNREFWGFPWQVNEGDGNCVNLVDVVNSSGRGGWNYGNGISSTSSIWYNEIVNYPLM